jgi:hypothetical protein
MKITSRRSISSSVSQHNRQCTGLPIFGLTITHQRKRSLIQAGQQSIAPERFDHLRTACRSSPLPNSPATPSARSKSRTGPATSASFNERGIQARLRRKPGEPGISHRFWNSEGGDRDTGEHIRPQPRPIVLPDPLPDGHDGRPGAPGFMPHLLQGFNSAQRAAPHQNDL